MEPPLKPDQFYWWTDPKGVVRMVETRANGNGLLYLRECDKWSGWFGIEDFPGTFSPPIPAPDRLQAIQFMAAMSPWVYLKDSADPAIEHRSRCFFCGATETEGHKAQCPWIRAQGD